MSRIVVTSNPAAYPGLRTWTVALMDATNEVVWQQSKCLNNHNRDNLVQTLGELVLQADAADHEQ